MLLRYHSGTFILNQKQDILDPLHMYFQMYTLRVLRQILQKDISVDFVSDRPIFCDFLNLLGRIKQRGLETSVKNTICLGL